MARILALDAGTTGVTGMVFDTAMRPVGRAYQEFTQHYPRPGWVEHDAQEIWSAAEAVMDAAVMDAGGDAPDAIGITDQRETTVVWDRATGKPVHRAIVWQDRRTAARCEELRPDWQERVQQRTGLVLDPYFSATKLEWILENVEGARRMAESGALAFGTIESWLAWNLTGGPSGGAHVTDETNASRTLLWDIHKGAWDPELLSLFDVPETLLPEVVPSAHVAGSARRWDAEVPVAGLVGDQQAALFGQHCHEAGQAKNTYGTGCFALQHTGSESVASANGLLTTRAASPDGSPRFALEGSVFIGGAAIQWLRDGLKLIDTSPEVNDRAAEGDDSEGVVVVPAFAGLGAPHWDPDARGAILGLTRGTSRRHIARATLEAIAFQSLDVLDAMERDSGLHLPRLMVDGGATRSELLMQFQADMLQRPVVRPGQVEATACGAALLAGIGAGLLDKDDLPTPDAEAAVFEPQMAKEEADRHRRAWQAGVDAVRAFKPNGSAR